MNFFDMGIMEILLIIVVALVIWGPGKIPQIARNIGKTVAALKKASQDLTSQISKELGEDEQTSPAQKLEQSSNEDKTRSAEENPPVEESETTGDTDGSKADNQ